MKNSITVGAFLTWVAFTASTALCQAVGASSEAMHANMAADRTVRTEVASAEDTVVVSDTSSRNTTTETTSHHDSDADKMPPRIEIKPVGQKQTHPAMITDNSFDVEIIHSSGFALVDFNATWCGPCRKMGPVMQALAEDGIGAKIAKLDVSDNPLTADRFNVYRIPCLILFKDGKEIDRREGARPKEEIIEWVQSMSVVEVAKTTSVSK